VDPTVEANSAPQTPSWIGKGTREEKNGKGRKGREGKKGSMEQE